MKNTNFKSNVYITHNTVPLLALDQYYTVSSLLQSQLVKEYNEWLSPCQQTFRFTLQSRTSLLAYSRYALGMVSLRPFQCLYRSTTLRCRHSSTELSIASDIARRSYDETFYLINWVIKRKQDSYIARHYAAECRTVWGTACFTILFSLSPSLFFSDRYISASIQTDLRILNILIYMGNQKAPIWLSVWLCTQTDCVWNNQHRSRIVIIFWKSD